jgi:NTE family protein
LSIFGRKRKVGLALSGGAARGLSHVGVLEVIEGLGIRPDAIAGTSMGAIIGAFYCSGITLEEIKSYVKSMNWKSFLLFSDIVVSRTGIINGKKVEEVLEKFLGKKTFSSCRIPFCCVAVDLVKRERVILSEGKLIDAVRASISIPGFFSTVYMDGRILVDGGLIEPLPTEAIKTMNINFTIASSVKFEKDRDKYKKFLPEDFNCRKGDNGDPSNVSKNTVRASGNKIFKFKKKSEPLKDNLELLSVKGVLDTSFNIMHRELIKSYIKNADILIEPEVGDFGFFDLMHGSQIIQRGREAAREKIPEIRKKLGL